MLMGRGQGGLLAWISPGKSLCFQAEAMLCLNKGFFTSLLGKGKVSTEEENPLAAHQAEIVSCNLFLTCVHQIFPQLHFL